MGTTVPARAVTSPGVPEPFQGTKRAAERLAHEAGVGLGLHRFFIVVAVVLSLAAVTGLWAWGARVGHRALAGRQGLVLVPTESFDPNVEEILRFAAALAGCRAARLAPRWSRGVRVRLSSVGGQLAYVVEGAPWLMPVLRSGAFAEVELRPVPTLGAASVVGFGSAGPAPAKGQVPGIEEKREEGTDDEGADDA